MNILNRLSKKMQLFHWNIGFVYETIESILNKNQSRLNINWIKHNYKDRFFADPFILSVEENSIYVLVEEFFYRKWKGVITLLCIDKVTYEIKNRKVLLDLPTHLSYPFIFREEGRTYILPENASSQSLVLYEYDNVTQSLTKVAKLLDEPIVDPTLYKDSDFYYLFCTKGLARENEDLYIYRADKINGEYKLISLNPIKTDKSSARPGGWMGWNKDSLIRISQNSSHTYGEGLVINKMDSSSIQNYNEIVILKISPDDKYKYGLHTLDMFGDICVVDGLKYIFNPLMKINHSLNKF